MERILTNMAEAFYNTESGAVGKFTLHCHHQYEVYYFVSGDVSYFVEGQYYKPTPHSMLLLSPNVFHGVRLESEAPYLRFALHFLPEALPVEAREYMLAPFINGRKQKSIFYEQVDRFGLDAYFNQLIDCRKMNQETRALCVPFRVQSLLTQILFISETLKPTLQAKTRTDRVAGWIEYLNENLSRPLSLDELSSRFYVSKHHMNKVFRQATGTTVIDYVARKRITLAQQMIAQGVPAGEAALRTGFHDYSVFYKAYKKIMGCSPSSRVKTL